MNADVKSGISVYLDLDAFYGESEVATHLN